MPFNFFSALDSLELSHTVLRTTTPGQLFNLDAATPFAWDRIDPLLIWTGSSDASIQIYPQDDLSLNFTLLFITIPIGLCDKVFVECSFLYEFQLSKLHSRNYLY